MPEKTFTVEKLVASRLKSGVKEYLVRWEGYGDKHDSWEPMENLSNLVEGRPGTEVHRAPKDFHALRFRLKSCPKLLPLLCPLCYLLFGLGRVCGI